MTAALALLGAVLAGLVACGQTTGNTDAGARAGGPDLNGTTYVVTGVTQGGQRRALVRGTEIRIAFADGRVTLTAGCNTMSGGYAFDNTRMTVAPLAMTDMGCPAPQAQQDAWLAGLFESPVQFSAGAAPAIISGRTVLSLADRRTSSPDASLTGTRWDVSGLLDGGIASSTRVRATLRISADGRAASVDERCSRETYSIEVVADRITWSAPTEYPHPCPPPRDSAGEQAVSAALRSVLHGATRFTIVERTLRITRDSQGLVLTAQPPVGEQ